LVQSWVETYPWHETLAQFDGLASNRVGIDFGNGTNLDFFASTRLKSAELAAISFETLSLAPEDYLPPKSWSKDEVLIELFHGIQRDFHQVLKSFSFPFLARHSILN
jgi:hypothetical protein